MFHTATTRLSDRTAQVIWALLATAMWAWLARDLLTVIVCTVATVPYTDYLIRKALGLRTSAVHMAGTVFAFLCLAWFVVSVVALLAALGNFTDFYAAMSMMVTYAILTGLAAMAWATASALFDKDKSLFLVRLFTMLFTVVWLGGMLVLWRTTVNDTATAMQFAWLTSLPTAALLASFAFSRQILRKMEG